MASLSGNHVVCGIPLGGLRDTRETPTKVICVWPQIRNTVLLNVKQEYYSLDSDVVLVVTGGSSQLK